MSWGEKEGRHRPWIFLLVFCGSPNVVVHWFCLHSCMSGVKPLFKVHPKMKAIIFVCLYIFMAGVQLLSLPCHVSESTNFQTQVVPLLLPGIGKTFVSSGSIPLQKIWDLCFVLFFLVVLKYHSHLHVIGWPFVGCLLFFLSLTEIYLPSLSNFDSPYPTTVCLLLGSHTKSYLKKINQINKKYFKKFLK